MSPPRGSVRPARPDDRAAVAALWEALLAEHAALDAAFSVRPGAGTELPAAVDRILRDPAAAVWVWEGPEGVAGFCAALRRVAPPAAAERQRIEITEIAVAPRARRQGVGTALACVALDWAKALDVRRIEVRVAARNPAGAAFWGALGFTGFVNVLDRRL